MYLVDTSVWIDYLRGKESLAQIVFSDILEQQIPFGITPLIFQEVLQGSKTKKDYEKLNDYLGSQRFYVSADQVEAGRQASFLYFKCRKKGITIRSTIDCLIAWSAIEHNLVLLHSDVDFVQISQVDGRLRLS